MRRGGSAPGSAGPRSRTSAPKGPSSSSERGSDGEARPQVLDQLGREAGDLLQVVDRPVAAETFPVSKDPGRLGDREVGVAKLFEGGAVQVDPARLGAGARPAAAEKR